MVDRSGSPASHTPDERRAYPRYRMAASVQITQEGASKRIVAQLADLSMGGCRIETEELLALGTAVELTITRESQSIQAKARAVYALPRKAVGLLFTAVEPAHQNTLQNWLAATQETRWLAAHRRRSQRVVMRAPVRVSGQNNLGAKFNEDAVTEVVSAHGALVLLSAPVIKGQRLILTNSRTGASQECLVVHFAEPSDKDRKRVGLEFVLQNQDFWQITFPPAAHSPR